MLLVVVAGEDTGVVVVLVVIGPEVSDGKIVVGKTCSVVICEVVTLVVTGEVVTDGWVVVCSVSGSARVFVNVYCVCNEDIEMIVHVQRY